MQRTVASELILGVRKLRVACRKCSATRRSTSTSARLHKSRHVGPGARARWDGIRKLPRITRAHIFLRPVDGRQRLELGMDTNGNGSTFAGEPACEKTSWTLEKDGRREELQGRR